MEEIKKETKNYYNKKKVVGKRLKECRLEKNIPTREVVKHLGCKYQTLMGYEAGRRTPNDDIKCKICNLYGVTVQSIFFSQDY